MCFLLYKWTNSGLPEIEGTILETLQRLNEMAKRHFSISESSVR